VTILIAVIIIAVLILVHELGHFVVARRIGIPVYEFSVGFGFKIFSWKRDEVEYSLRIIPLGGFVRMAGEEADDQANPDGFSRRTPMEKIRVAFAGPFMNFALAVFIFIYSYTFIGIPQADNEPVIGKVLANQPAEEAGIMSGDRVLSVNDTSLATWQEFTKLLAAESGSEVIILEIERDNQIIEIEVMPEMNSTTGVPVIGVLSNIDYQKQGLFTAIKIGLQQTYELTILLLSGLLTMITGGASAAEIAGPVGIVSLIGDAAQVGMVFLLSFAAFLSINLGILNLLPIPAMDGSRILFAIIEAIRKKPLNPEKEGFIHWLGFMFLMLLIVIVTFNDIVKLIKG